MHSVSTTLRVGPYSRSVPGARRKRGMGPAAWLSAESATSHVTAVRPQTAARGRRACGVGGGGSELKEGEEELSQQQLLVQRGTTSGAAPGTARYCVRSSLRICEALLRVMDRCSATCYGIASCIHYVGALAEARRHRSVPGIA
eukprot:2071218-Rhodomonas_salina.3